MRAEVCVYHGPLAGVVQSGPVPSSLAKRSIETLAHTEGKNINQVVWECCHAAVLASDLRRAFRSTDGLGRFCSFHIWSSLDLEDLVSSPSPRRSTSPSCPALDLHSLDWTDDNFSHVQVHSPVRRASREFCGALPCTYDRRARECWGDTHHQDRLVHVNYMNTLFCSIDEWDRHTHLYRLIKDHGEGASLSIACFKFLFHIHSWYMQLASASYILTLDDWLTTAARAIRSCIEAHSLAWMPSVREEQCMKCEVDDVACV